MEALKGQDVVWGYAVYLERYCTHAALEPFPSRWDQCSELAPRRREVSPISHSTYDPVSDVSPYRDEAAG